MTSLIDVPLPSEVREGKFYLPAFNLVATVPSQAAAEALEAGLMELIQYRGNPVAWCNVAMGRTAGDERGPFDPTAPPCESVVAMATRLQLFASVMIGDRDEDADRLLNLVDGGRHEPWEVDYVKATALFLRHDFEGATTATIANLAKHPFDAFSARLLLIAAYFGEDPESLCDGFGAIVAEYEHAIAEQARAAAHHDGPPKHALHLALPSLMAWAAFGYEETRRDVTRAEELGRRAIQLTHVNNERYLPSGRPSTDMPERRGALAAVADDSPFTCVFGVHVVCHCFETRGDAAGGLKFIREVDANLWQPAVHLAGHLWWHVALFQLELGDVGDAMATYNQWLANAPTADPFALSDGSALVLRVWIYSQWFAVQPGRGCDRWNKDTIAAAHQREAAEALLQLNKQWQEHNDSIIADFPFFAAKKYFTHAAAAWIDPASKTFRPWPVPALPLPIATSPAIGDITSGRQRRDVLVAGLKAGSARLQIAGAAAEPAVQASELMGGLGEWLALVDRLSPSKPPSLTARVLRAAGPMGGSVAQQRLISTTLFLVAILSNRRTEAKVALQALCQQQPHAHFWHGVRLASQL